MEMVRLNGTKKNDVFEIDLDKSGAYIIDGNSGGKDTISLTSSNEWLFPDNLSFEVVPDETLTETLLITHTSHKGSEDITVEILIKNYFSSPEKNSTNSSIKYFEINKSKYTLSDWLTYEGTIEPNKKGVLNGTAFTDEILGTDGNDKIYGNGGSDIISGGAGNDIIKASSGLMNTAFGNDDDDKIYGTKGFMNMLAGGDGDDIIKAASHFIKEPNFMYTYYAQAYGGRNNYPLNLIMGDAGDDKLYAGKGTDLFMYQAEDEVPGSDGHDTIYSTDQYDKLVFDGINWDNFTFDKKGNHLIINTDDDSSIKLVNYFKGKEGKVLDTLTDGNFGEEVTESISKIARIDIEGEGKINGTFLNDNIEGSDKKDTIKAGAGNDFIYAGAGNDKITGGKGSNQIFFEQGDGNDTIYLTKGENLTINYFATDNYNDLCNQFYVYEKGNDVIIARLYTTELGEEKIDSITIKNLGKNDLAERVICNVYKEDSPRSIDGNNWELEFSENMTDFIYLREGVIKGNKGATIKGTNLNEAFIGTDLKDTIKTGDGVNVVYSGMGDDYIDSTKGNNTIYIEDGDGNDTILASGNSETTIALDGYNYIGYKKKGNDLIITHTPGTAPADLDDEPSDTPETITLKNYFKTDKKGNLIKKNVSICNNSNKTDLYDDLENTYINVIGKENKANKIDLRKYQDTFNFEVFGGNKNDKIYLGAGNHRVDSGAGNDTITVGNGYNEIYTGEGNDTVKAGNGDNIFYYTSGNDIYESGSGHDSYCVEYSSDMNLKIRDNGGYSDGLNIMNLDGENTYAFFNVNKNGDIIVSDNNSTKLSEFYIFGVDEDGNSKLNYDNIMLGLKGKNMTGVIEIENAFEKTFSIDNRATEITVGRGFIENISIGEYYHDDYELSDAGLGDIINSVANWLSSYKDGYFESSIDVLSRGNKDDIEAMLSAYNSQSLESTRPEE